MGSQGPGGVLSPQRQYSQSQYPQGPPPGHDPLDDWSAAEVLASFNKFPIKTANNQHQSTNGLNQNGKRPAGADPLSADIGAASIGSENANLPSALAPFVHGSPFANTSTKAGGLSNCPGATGLGGVLVPGGPKGPSYENLDRHQPPAKPSHDTAFVNGPASAPPAPSTQGRHNNSNGASKSAPPPPDGSFKTTFQFVVNEDAKEARNTVRKHVMREYRRRERWEQGLKKEGEGDDVGPDYKGPSAGGKRQRKRERPSSDSDPSNSSGEAVGSSSNSESGEGASNGAITWPDAKRRRLDLARNGTNGVNGQQQLFGLAGEAEEAIHELGGVHALPYQADPYAEIAAADIDPFSRFSLQLGPATRSLLHHFAWVMPSLMDEIVTGNVFRRMGWMYANVAVHDPTPVHTILGFTTGHLANLRGLDEPAFATEHKAKAIKLINERIEDPMEALSDNTIGAIVNIAGWELIDCNPGSFALHMSGIHRIVMTRGGMDSLTHNTELQTVLIRLDAIRVYITLSAPRFPVYTPLRSLPSLAIPVPSPYTPAMPDPTPQVFEHIYCAEALHLLHGIEDVLLLIRAGALDTLIPVGAPYAQLLSAQLDQLFAPSASHLLTARVSDAGMPVQNPSPTSPNTPQPRSAYGGATRRQREAARTLRLAALVFVDLAVSEFFDAPPPPPNAKRRLPGVYAKRLKQRFLGPLAPASSTATPWGRSLEMVVAVLLQADRLMLEKPWRAWYFADGLTLTMALGADAWAAVGGALRAYLHERIAETRRDEPPPGMTVGGEAVEGLVKGEPRSRKIWDLEKQLDSLLREWGEDVA